MCGLVGVASTDPQTERSWLLSARDTLEHRGPDDAGEWWSDDGKVGLAHRRLSILDLSPLGRQPMHLFAHGLSVVFNGEIYNFAELQLELESLGHLFQTKSDTEVLLTAYAEWGAGCLERFNGMFALALFDTKQQRLLLARDRAGEKPLFYRLEGNTLYFASELKALLANPKLPRRIEPLALDCYLAMGYVPGELCMLKGYSKLPPAHALSFDLRQGRKEIWRYWSLPELSSEKIDEEVLCDDLEHLLEDAVGKQLVADVPVGVLLSGGVDSSIITALAVRHSAKVRTFSVGFPGHGKLDETPHARLIANHFGTDHIELMAEPATADLIPLLARQFDEPMVDSSMLPTYLVSQLVRQHCTVALGGDGGDELFGGYAHYSHLLWLQEKLKSMPRLLGQMVGCVVEHTVPTGIRGRNYVQALAVDLEHGLPLINYLFNKTARQKLLRSRIVNFPDAESIFQKSLPPQASILQRSTRMDFQNYLPEDILVKVDRASMFHSLEVRAPLLDHRVIEFAFGRIPAQLKATASQKKILLKRLTERLLPDGFDRQRKQGFSIPLNTWLKQGPFRDLFWDVLTQQNGTFDRKAVNRLLRLQDLGLNNGERLFALVTMALGGGCYGFVIGKNPAAQAICTLMHARKE